MYRRKAANDKEMLIMIHEIAVQAEIDYRRRRFLREAANERVAKEIREAKSARSR